MLNPQINPIKNIGKCDVCDVELEVTLHYGNMHFCDECWMKEVKATQVNMTPEKQQERIDKYSQKEIEQPIPINDILRTSREIDDKIKVRTDLFNSETTSIIELKQAIDVDNSISNKPYELARILTERFNKFKTVVFELNEQLIEAGNRQKAIHTYLNTLANQLRAEERERLKIADINYKPTPPKSIKVREIKTRQTNKKTKIDKVELRTKAAELGISEFTLQTICIASNCSVSEGVEILKKMTSRGK